MSKEKTKFVCKECGNEYTRWQGKCTGCNQWNTLEEETYYTGKAAQGAKIIIADGDKRVEALKDVRKEDYPGFSTGMGEMDRALGGKVVDGSFVLISGEPGKGKSTLLLQMVVNVAKHVGDVVYFSGEEAKHQIKGRSDRIFGEECPPNLFVMHTRDIDEIEKVCEAKNPRLIIVDSIQTTGDSNIASEPGSPAQIKSCTARLMNLAKGKGITVFVVGHVTKESNIAGPKMLEHMVDAVLYLEGEKYNDLRLLRLHKNRFGNANELGVFQMEETGLVEVTNPSEFLLSNRLGGASGSIVVSISENARPLLIEMQALVAGIAQNAMPRRTSEGFSRNRLSIIVAVLEKKCGLNLSFKDVYVNVVGGMEVEEPTADLGVALALYSSDKNLPVDPQTVVVGEIGLTGEVRPVPNIEQLVREAEKVGFNKFVLPKKNYDRVKDKAGKLQFVPVETVRGAIEALFGKMEPKKSRKKDEEEE